MTPTSLLFVVCHALAIQGPLDVNGFPVDGIKLDETSCRNEIVPMDDATAQGNPEQFPDFSNPYVCSRMAMTETPHWELIHPGWFVKRVKCPHPDGTFPNDDNV